MTATIFDCDGTLIDSGILVNEMLVEMVAEHGLTLSVDDALAHFRDSKMAEIVNQIAVWLGRSVPESFLPDVRERTAEAFRIRIKPIESVIDLVRATTGRFCVASSRPVEKFRLNLSLTGLLPFFEGRIFSSYEVGFEKPDPRLFLHAAHVMGVALQECEVVEYSLPGIQAGVAAGMEVFAFQPNGVDPGIPLGVVIVKRLSDLQSKPRRPSR